MSYTLTITPDAEDQLTELAAWWEANRPAASKLTDELNKVGVLIGENPRLPPVHRRRRDFEARRVRLGASPYYLYYTIDEGEHEILVLAFWSAMRRVGPDL
ncbi:MAG: type II toxin-antitoxin system RelE/ParE family toxin [Myxococcales bacterium]|nr:type II toxin-antitoxin system RelE/ParE family toxin [Myxococcales bacterium]